MDPIVANLHEQYFNARCKTICTALPAAFIILSALAIIACPAFCLSFPSINVISQYIFPFVVPGISLLALSIPLIYLCFTSSRQLNRTWHLILDAIHDDLEANEVAEMETKKERVDFIKDLLPRGEKFYKSALLAALKKKYPEKKSLPKDDPRNQILDAFDDVKRDIFRNK